MLSDTVVREEDWAAFAADAEAQRRDTPYLLLYSRQEPGGAEAALPDASSLEDAAACATAV